MGLDTSPDNNMKSLQKWAGIGACAAGGWFMVEYMIMTGQATSAPQQAAVAAMVAAKCIAAYVFLRGLDMIATSRT